MVHASCTPVIAVSQDMYDAILLADRVMVVAEGKPKLSRMVGEGLPDFFSVRECYLTAGYEAQAALMVGG